MFAWLMGLPTISPHALHQRMQRERVIVIDVNHRDGWTKARVPDAAARRARGMGYDHVHVMSAGIAGWLDAALPTESDQSFART
jgi:rhodanese-related sulfurtransferase